jgi:protein associated with RNAse G/E
VELTPGGNLERAVCRVCLPPAFAGSVLSIVELGLTMTVEPGPRVMVEEDEFQEQAADYGYPPQLRADARAAIEEVRGLLAEGAGPFGPDLAKMHALALKAPRPARA